MKRYTKQQVLEAIVQSRGIVSHVARRLGCAWSTARIYIDKWEETKQALENEREVLLDDLECKLLEMATAGDLGAIKWYLSHMGRHRGWGDDEAPQQGSVRVVVKWADDDDTD
jgi:transposase-like protein